MTPWALSFTGTFYSELLNLPKAVQKKIKKTLKVLEADPISAQGDAKKLRGYSNNVYRVRMGDYRLFYSFGQGWVKLLSVRKRDERTYEIELSEVDDPAPPPESSVLDPQAIEVVPSDPATVSPTATAEAAGADEATSLIQTSLPFELTDAVLRQWQLPPEYWSAIQATSHSEALLELPVPEQYIQRIVDNLYPKPIEDIIEEREYVLQQPEDLERFVAGSLTHFLLKLDPEQEKLRDFGKQGPILVKGGPGTGKSTLALYRVQNLLAQGFKPVLFTTFTKALVTYSEQLLSQLLGQPLDRAGVKVATVDALARRYYVQTHGEPQFADKAQRLALLREALHTTAIPAKNAFDLQVRRQTLERLGLPYLMQEIQDVIDGWGLTTLDEYLALERRGRGVPLQATVRTALWSVYQTWRRLMQRDGWTTWPQLRCQALAVAEQLPDPPYQAIVIDEAQDLSPVALRFLLALVPSLKGFYLTADASQSLYQRGFSWKQIHTDLKVSGRTLQLKRNYRNTRQIMAACRTILADTAAGDADSLSLEPSAYQGATPTLVLTDSVEQESRLILAFFKAAAKRFRLPIYGGAVLCPRKDMGTAIAQRLVDQGTAAQFVSGRDIDLQGTYIKVLTLHSAKGLEFPFVAIVGLRQGILPYISADLPDDELAAVSDEQRRLFYVGCSRAMRALLVCGSRSNPSSFLDPLTDPDWQR
ncbi:AAA family ATPase [Romeria aff. gracilis LEGE 07310]|uniref:DNA 3'-5' helicase n=1 Tax=Vasconcelosia minhoensis LEGE 07310 TaxID=915328 RepID=A0A8J7AFP5_9CYAN|nr:3'-5' exonuclease [Romeria gracilis]MBE9078401.1 AAA family ATPase [Romeria aff. gracilis LEGE 07310]